MAAHDDVVRPRRLDRYLLLREGEQVVFAVRRHWASVSLPVAAAVAALALALVADFRLPRGFGLVANLLVWVSVAAVLWAAYCVIQWRHDWLVATNKRLLFSTGLLTQSAPMMPLARVTDMNYQRTIPGRVLGYGKFVMESAGQHQALNVVNWVPDPDHNYRILIREIFSISPPEDEQPSASEDLDGWEQSSDHREPEDTPDHSTAIRVRGRESVYRSPDLSASDRSADTGPIRRYPPDHGGFG